MNALPISPAIERWNVRFAADPVQAIGDLLAGRIFLGPFARARPAEALVQILTPKQIPQADRALRDWLGQIFGAPARGNLPGKRFAATLIEAFDTVLLVPLPESRAWCAANQGRLRPWLRGFYFDRSRDPEAGLLIALTQGQPDRRLLGLWLGLTGLAGGYARTMRASASPACACAGGRRRRGRVFGASGHAAGHAGLR